MPEPYLTIALALIGSGVLTTILTAIINRKQAKAHASDTIVNAAMRVTNELQEDLTRIRQERKEDWENFARYKQEMAEKIHELEAELKIQEKALDNLTTRAMKYQFALSIIVNQLRTIGLEPVIDPDDIEAMKVDDMRLIAEGASNVERRRRERKGD